MPRTGLDREGVIRAAAGLADAEGLPALSLARLAAHLGVRPPSLYNHVAGQAGLQRELALLGVRELGARLQRAAVGRAGDDAVLAVAEAYRAFVRRHPGLYAASVRAPDPEDADLREASDAVVALVADVLRAYGLEGEGAVHAIRGLRAIAHGFASIEAGGGFGLPVDPDESFRRLVRAFTAGLRHPERHHPGVHSAAGEEPPAGDTADGAEPADAPASA